MRKLKVNIYQLMASRNIRTVTEISRSTNISSKALYDIINGKTRRIDFDTIEKLCRFFDCGVGDLLILEDIKKVG
ncbi:helix-turn-helix domain-containing protein [Virgibacillus oceani]